jgi:hypothetical protein
VYPVLHTAELQVEFYYLCLKGSRAVNIWNTGYGYVVLHFCFVSAALNFHHSVYILQHAVPFLCNDGVMEHALLGNGRWTRSCGYDIQSIARQATMTKIGLLEAVLSIGSAPRLYSEALRPTECSLVKKLVC